MAKIRNLYFPTAATDFHRWKKTCSISKICERKRTPADYANNADQDAYLK
ncbi:hypothetical protein [Chryseobacterium lineare]